MRIRRLFYSRVHSPGLLARFVDLARRREQMLVRGPENWPLLLLSFDARDRDPADELRDAWLHTLPSLRCEAVGPYVNMLPLLPSVVVVLLRRRNICTCLGHHHPRGTESRLTRRLASDTGGEVGELDLAFEAIRKWVPLPLFSLAAAADEPRFAALAFRTALLTVLLHELEHLAYPDRQEKAVRQASDHLYKHLLEEMLAFG